MIDANQLKDIRKAHQIEIITIKKNARKATIEFFKEKSEHVMRIFKQEQMFMVEEYFDLKQRDIKKESTIAKSYQVIKMQERIIQEITCFMHDCLDRIFQKALVKGPQVLKALRENGFRVDRSVRTDAFQLYNSYMELVQPIEIEAEVDEYESRIAELEILMEQNNAKCDAIQSACEHYLKEEKEIKEYVKKLEAQLYNEKLNRQTDIAELKSKYQDLEFKYTQDVEEV